MLEDIIKDKFSSLQIEHNKIMKAIEELRRNFSILDKRRIELEGAIKEISEIINMKVTNNDTESETPQRSDINQG